MTAQTHETTAEKFFHAMVAGDRDTVADRFDSSGHISRIDEYLNPAAPAPLLT